MSPTHFILAMSLCDMVKHELRVASCELLVTCWKLKSASWDSKVWVQIHELQVQLYEFRLQMHKLRVQIHELRVEIYELRVQIHELRFQIHKFKNHLINEIQVNSLKTSSFPKALSLKLFGNLWGNLSVKFLVTISCFTFPLFLRYDFSRKPCK